MPKIRIDKTREEMEQELAAEEQRRYEEIQQAELERQVKLAAIHKKQKTTKIIIISIFSIFSLLLIFFGTYNTFFKKTLQIEEVIPEIDARTNALKFNSDSIDNYLRDNCTSLVNKYMDVTNNKTIKYVSVDKDTCRISKVVKLSNTLAQVIFDVDITVTENDTEVTDPEVIKYLKRMGFNTNPIPSSTTASETEPTVEPTAEPTVEPTAEPTAEPTVEPTAEPTAEPTKKVEESKEKESTEKESTEKVEESSPSIAPEEDGGYSYINTVDEEGNAVYYYIDGNKIMKSGKSTTQRYKFFLVIENFVNENGTNGFRPATEMTLYSLVPVDQDNFDEIKVFDAFKCDDSTLLDKDTINKISIKVDKTLQDLYEGRDTSQDFFNKYQFNTYNARYNGITSIQSYGQTNYFGFNTHVRYSITTEQGFDYTLDTWMLIEASGNSYVIKGFL